MRLQLLHRALWLAGTACLVSGLLWLDQNRGGAASMLSRCNLLLSRSESAPADVLIFGSSRTGTSLDPIAMQEMLGHAVSHTSHGEAKGGLTPRVERIALPVSPLRSSHALLENYLEDRGAPRVIAVEIAFLTQQSVEKLAKQQALKIPPERYLFRRDLNLLTFDQILRLPSVAMPFSEQEGPVNLWRFRLRGIVLRAGSLVYQFFRDSEPWTAAACNKATWTREPSWPEHLAFSYGDFTPHGPPRTEIDLLEAKMDEASRTRELKDWQLEIATKERYPYDFDAAYREGEVALLEAITDLAAAHDVPVVLLALPLYGYVPDIDEVRSLAATLPGHIHPFDLYGHVQADLDKFWLDDGHLETYPAGALTTAIFAQHLLDSGLLTRRHTVPEHD